MQGAKTSKKPCSRVGAIVETRAAATGHPRASWCRTAGSADTQIPRPITKLKKTKIATKSTTRAASPTCPTIPAWPPSHPNSNGVR